MAERERAACAGASSAGRATTAQLMLPDHANPTTTNVHGGEVRPRSAPTRGAGAAGARAPPSRERRFPFLLVRLVLPVLDCALRIYTLRVHIKPPKMAACKVTACESLRCGNPEGGLGAHYC